jgi:hypothetical protein
MDLTLTDNVVGHQRADIEPVFHFVSVEGMDVRPYLRPCSADSKNTEEYLAGILASEHHYWSRPTHLAQIPSTSSNDTRQGGL